MVEGLYVARVVSEEGEKRIVYPAFTTAGHKDNSEATSAFLERLHRECVKSHGFRPASYEYEVLNDGSLSTAFEWAGITPHKADVLLY